MRWLLLEVSDVLAWRKSLSSLDQRRVARAYDALASAGPQLGRPLVDRLEGSSIHNLKELRIRGSAGSEFRVLFVFDPARQAVLLVAGDKKGEWESWYQKQIQVAEIRYREHLDQISRSGTSKKS